MIDVACRFQVRSIHQSASVPLALAAAQHFACYDVQTGSVSWCILAMAVQGLKACSMIYGSTTPLQSVEQLQDMGYHIVLRPLSGQCASHPSVCQAAAVPFLLCLHLLLQSASVMIP